MKKAFLGFVLVAAVLGAGWYFGWSNGTTSGRGPAVIAWLQNPAAHPEWRLQAQTRCGAAPFLFPTEGMIGYIWGDSFRPGHRHQGLDIFGGAPPGQTPVYAVADGYLTRLPAWKSAVILRIPHDPLHPERQIWVYYAHMADADGTSFIVDDFPPGTYEQFVTAGSLLGYQGNYSGNPLRPVGVHLHLSIVKDDGRGQFLNETNIGNTYDPSPYFNMNLNAYSNRMQVPLCEEMNR